MPGREVERTPAQQGAEENIIRALEHAVQIVVALQGLEGAGAALDADEADRVLTWAGTLEAGAHALGLIARKVAQDKQEKDELVDLTS
jgi:hypothetical protein